MLTDRYAYSNAWRDIHPAVKGVFAGFGLAASLAAASPVVPLLVLAVMTGAAVGGARIPAVVFLKLLFVPTGFLLAGVAGLALSFSAGDLRLLSLPELGFSIYLSYAGVRQAGLVLARAVGAAGGLVFLALTTPLTEIVTMLRSLRVPHLLLELMVLAYRQLFALLQVVRAMQVAQHSRLGYATAAGRLRALAALAANLSMRSHQRSRQMHQALLSRGFDGELRWLERERTLPAGSLALAVLCGGMLLALALLVKG